MESAEFAGIGQKDGDEITLSVVAIERPPDDTSEETADARTGNGSPPEERESKGDNQKQSHSPKPPATNPPSEHAPSGRSVIHVNIELDSSLDTEKLQKQLELLRKYGAI